jgi:hypothetical protein
MLEGGGLLWGTKCSVVLRRCEVKVEGKGRPERQACFVVEWWRVIKSACIVGVRRSWSGGGDEAVCTRWTVLIC